MPADPRITAALKLQTPFEDPSWIADEILSSSCSDDDTASTNTDEEDLAASTGMVVSVEEARATKRARTAGAEFLDRDSLWGLLRPVVMPDATGE